MLDGRSAVTAATMIGRFEALRPVLVGQLQRFDAERRLPDEVFAALSGAGFFRLQCPRDLGGCELSPLEFMEVVEHAAAFDGTVGWLVGNGGGMARVGGYLPQAGGEAIFADPGAFVASSTAAVGRAVPAEGGYRITGRWPYSSGAPQATRFAAVCEIEGTEKAVLGVLPRESVTLHDTWHVSWLRGTGSWDFEAEDVLLGAEFVCDLPPEPTRPGILYRLPSRSAFVWTVATVPLGIAKGALEALAGIGASHKRLSGTGPIAGRDGVQAEIGRLTAQCRAAGAYMRAAMQALCTAVETGSDLTETRLDFRLACSNAAEVAVAAVLRVNDLVGARALAEGQPFERRERDVRAAAKHTAMSPEQFVIGGRHVLGDDIAEASF